MPLFTCIKMDGTLVIRATEEIEDYALQQWKKQHDSGKAKLVIETGKAYSLNDIIQKLGKNVAEFQSWWIQQDRKAVVPELDKQE